MVPAVNPAATNVFQGEISDRNVTAFAQNKEVVLEKRAFGDQAEGEAWSAEQRTEHLRMDSKPYQSGTSDGYENLSLEE